LRELQLSSAVFNSFTGVDTSWLKLREFTRSSVDLGQDGHRSAVIRWLNSWGCRIRYPRPGEPDLLNSGLSSWWANWAAALPRTSLVLLSDTEIGLLSRAYEELAMIPVKLGNGGRTLGPTAAAKTLYAVHPAGVMPWDAAIAARLHGARNSAAFAAHLRLGRDWAIALLDATGADEYTIPTLAGRASVPLSKLLDEHLYIVITRDGKSADDTLTE
jgi:hypothetical protein